MSPRQQLAMMSLNKGLMATDTQAACNVAFIGVVFRLEGEHGSLRFPLAYTREQYAESGNCFSLFRMVAIRGDYPVRARGSLIAEEYRWAEREIRHQYSEFTVRWIRHIGLKRSVYQWCPGMACRHSWGTLLENLRLLVAPERFNEVWRVDPRVVSYGWYLMDEMPSVIH